MRFYHYLFLCLIAIMTFQPAYAQQKHTAKRTIIVGGDFNFPPYEFKDKDQNPTGYNVELTQSIADAMDIKVEFRLGKWSKVKSWLDNGEIDAIEGMAYFSIRYR